MVVGDTDKAINQGDVRHKAGAVRKHVDGCTRVRTDFVRDRESVAEGTKAGTQATSRTKSHGGRVLIMVKVGKMLVGAVVISELGQGGKLVDRCGTGDVASGSGRSGNRGGRDRVRRGAVWEGGARRREVTNEAAGTKDTPRGRLGGPPVTGRRGGWSRGGLRSDQETGGDEGTLSNI